MTNGARTANKTRERPSVPRGRKDKGYSPSHGKTLMPDIKRRRSNTSSNPQERFEHYVALARAAASADDGIVSENYYQHAEHYLRLMNRNAMGSKTR